MCNVSQLLSLCLPRRVSFHKLRPCLSRQGRQGCTASKRVSFKTTLTNFLKLIKYFNYLMDWSCCFWRSSSVLGEKGVPGWMGVVGADFFFWREWSSSIVWAFTVGPLSSWQTSFLFFWVRILGSPLRPLLLLLKLNSPFSAILIFSEIDMNNLSQPRPSRVLVVRLYILSSGWG